MLGSTNVCRINRTLKVYYIRKYVTSFTIFLIMFYLHTLTYMHTNTHIHARTHAHARTQTHTHARTHARTHAHTHARTHASPPTHTHTHTSSSMPIQSALIRNKGKPFSNSTKLNQIISKVNNLRTHTSTTATSILIYFTNTLLTKQGEYGMHTVYIVTATFCC